MSAVCRKAKLEDVEPLYQMIQGYAEKGIIAPVQKVLEKQIEEFVVAESEGNVIGRFLMPAGK